MGRTPAVMLKAAEVAAVYEGVLEAVERVAGPGRVDGEAREGGDARGHRHGRAAAEGPAAGVGPDGQAHLVALSEVSMLPLASSTATFTAGVMAAPAAALEGAWTKPSLVDGPTPVMLKAADVTAVYEGVLEAVSV